MRSKLSEIGGRRLLCLLVAVCLTGLLAACGGGSSSSNSSETTGATKTTEEETGGGGGGEVSGKTIGYIDTYLPGIDTRFANAFKEAAEKLGWSVQLQDARGEQEKALTAARNMINSGVDAIVASSVYGEWLTPIVPEAESKNIPLVEAITEQPPGIYTAQVVESQEATSMKLAEQIEKELPQGGEVAITYDEGYPSIVERKENLEKAFKGSNIKVVAAEAIAAAENSKVQKEAVDLLTTHPNLAAFISTSNIQIPEVLAALRTTGNSKAKVYGWYATAANVELMEENPNQFVGVVDSNIARAMWIVAGELATYFAGGEMKELQSAEYEPVIVKPNEITPAMHEEEGPVPFSEISPPFYKEWEKKFGT